MHRTAPSQARRRNSAFTLFEMLIATGTGSLIIGAIAAMSIYAGKTTAALGNYADLDRYSRNALDKMTLDIRQANHVSSYATNQLQFEMADPNTGVTNTLTYTYDSGAKTLTRIYAGTTNVLLKNINTNSLVFSMFQRNPIGGTVDQEATTNPAICKVVQLSWVCSRNILGRKANTESVQSAKVVIRKE